MSSEPEGARAFHVTTVREVVVAAAEPPPEERVRLSNLDLLLPETTFSVCSWFKKPNKMFVPDFGLIAHMIEKALRKVLVTYYPMAGEVVTGASGEPELLCNNRGVDLVFAAADVELPQLNFHLPHLSVAKFVPTKKRAILTIQLTELKCGSIAVGCTIDHRVVDAYSANMFFVSLIELALFQPLSVKPSFERSLLSPREPLLLDPSIDQMYVPVPSLPPSDDSSPQDPLVSRVYYIESAVMEQFQRQASSNGCQRTKLESFSAFLWQLMAKHAGKHDSDRLTSRLGVLVDGRRRLAAQETGEEMKRYFGNVLSIPYGAQRISDLIEKPLSWAANEVHEFLKGAETREHFLGLIDWVESHRPKPVLGRIYHSGCDEGPALVVSSGKELSMNGADFGWGRPVFGSCYFSWDSTAGYVMPMPSPAANGDWLVYLYLTKEQLDFIDQEASHVFKPVNGEYLGLNTLV